MDIGSVLLRDWSAGFKRVQSRLRRWFKRPGGLVQKGLIAACGAGSRVQSRLAPLVQGFKGSKVLFATLALFAVNPTSQCHL